MEILITEAAPGDADDVAGELTATGHQVSRCNLAGTDRCAPLVSGAGCPLHERPIAAVVDVRRRPVAFGQHELGAMCAVRAGVPLVVCGPTPDEAGPWRDADVRCTEDALPDVLALADSVTGSATRRRVEHAVAAALRTLGRPAVAEVDIGSAPGVVRVVVSLAGPVPDLLHEVLPLAVRGALAGVTLHWAQAQVTIAEPQA